MFYVEQTEELFDILVMGGGHAGLESAWISNQFKLRVGIVTLPGVGLGSAPCNPAVGGVGKGQVVRELDALGGLMGRLADQAGIQYRILNESKGYAVQSTRVQIDKELYSQVAEEIIQSSSIQVIRDKVDRVFKGNDGLFVLKGAESSYKTKKLIVTTGTFLGGKLHTGPEVVDGGRVGQSPSESLEDLFTGIETLRARFKTGTPPRILRHSIDFSKMEEQPSDERTENFHWNNIECGRKSPQVSCYLTRTNEKALSIIRENKERSPIFNGQIKGIGPRYCPSIEDKAFRYLDRNTHHVFVEPEGLNIDTFYPNGVSTSLPREVQEEFLRKIPGLEKAEIAVYGYAVEYDIVNTLRLHQTLEHREVSGLYFAGQVCGTSGYEEAGGQGFVAGVNASLALKGSDPLILDRRVSYIGVMIEDLVTNERDEPYRLFTARSENRLYIREDNSIERMEPYRKRLGLNEAIDKFNMEFLALTKHLEAICHATQFMPTDENRELFKKLGWGSLKEKTSLSEVLQRSVVDPVSALSEILKLRGISLSRAIIKTVAIGVKYSGYIARETQDNESLHRLESKRINWESLLANSNLSFECKQRISKVRPATFGQLRRIEGIRPATLTFVASGL
jgi:tRNA uridine 5-carboxymethylaminomethyl modification enzyme